MSKSLEDILEGLPDLDFTDGIDADSIMADMIEDYNLEMTSLTGDDYRLSKADPMRAVLLACADILTQLTNLIDRNAKMNFLKYAYGEYLDQLGLLKGVSRRDAVAAVVTMQFTCEDDPAEDIVIPVGTEVTGEDDIYFTTDEEAVIPAAEFAITTVTITLSAASDEDIVIPAGTKVTDADETNFFTTRDQLTIAAGETSGEVVAVYSDPGESGNGIEAGTLTVIDAAIPNLSSITNTESSGGASSSRTATVTATCEDAGDIGNDFQPGDINDMIDDVDGVDSCVNIDTSQGGSDTEDDDDLRERIYEAPLLYSTTGPTKAYKYRTLEYSSAIQDVSVVSPEAGDVRVYVLLQDGELPGDAMLKKIQEYLSDEEVRPLTDQVSVLAPDVVSYDIELTYHIAKSDAKAEATIRGDVEDAVEQYQTWQSGQIGRAIDSSELIASLRDVGAVQCTITKPEITAVASTAVAIADTVKITYGGLVDG